MADKKNIIVGAARVWIGTAAAAKPAFVGGTSYNVTLDGTAGWRDAGYTQEGVEFSYEPEYYEVEVDQLLDTPRIGKTSVRNTLNTTFAEATFENLLVAWGQADNTLVSSVLTVAGGVLGEAPIERQLLIVGNGKENGAYFNERTYHFTRAVSMEAVSFSARRSEATVFPVSFRLLPSDATGNPYGTFSERPRTWAQA